LLANTNINTLVAKGKVVTCPSALIENAIPTNVPTWQAYGGYGHNYYYLGYTPESRVRLSTVMKPVETCKNGDGLGSLLFAVSTLLVQTLIGAPQTAEAIAKGRTSLRAKAQVNAHRRLQALQGRIFSTDRHYLQD
jgi:hypothetical protein